MPKVISRDRALLHDLAVEIGAQRALADVDTAHQAGADRAEAVLPLHAQHRAGVGVAEVLRADVVRRRESGQVVPDVRRRDVAHRPAHDRGDLALVVQVLAVRRPAERAAVRVERGRRLLEVGRRVESGAAGTRSGATRSSGGCRGSSSARTARGRWPTLRARADRRRAAGRHHRVSPSRRRPRAGCAGSPRADRRARRRVGHRWSARRRGAEKTLCSLVRSPFGLVHGATAPARATSNQTCTWPVPYEFS